ncbi:MAG: hypothetical protein RIS47_1423, partial [Bacteroidota bacterium]
MLSLKKKLCTNFAKLLALLLVFYSFPTVAQTYENIQLVDYATPRKYEVVDIKIVGVRYLDQNALIQLSGLTKGQTIEIPGDETTRAIEKLWKQGLFSEVKVLMEKLEGNKINLVFQLQERPRVSKLVFKGVKKADEKKINDILKIIPGAQVTDNLI